MKRIKSLLSIVLFIILTMVFIPDVNAASATIKVTSSQSRVIVGGTFTTTVTISSGTPIAAWEYDISYDTSKLTLVSGSNHVLEYTQNTNKYSATYTYTFKAKASGNANITAKNYLVSDWNESAMGVTPTTSSVKIITREEYEASLSKDCNLKSLGVEGAILSPEFSQDVLEYTVEMEPLTTKINIVGTKSDSSSTVTGLGEKDVVEGDNNFDITVTAENGSSKTYKLKVIVKEQSPIEVKIDKDKYTVVRKREDLPSIERYEEVDVKIGEEDVPGYYSSITKLTLVGLKNEKNEISLYIYDKEKNTYTPYLEINASKIILYQLELDNEDIPEGFKKTTIKIGDKEYTAYKNDKLKKYVLVYGMNTETGKKNLYLYEEKEQTLQLFNEDAFNSMIDEQNYYKNLLYCACGVIGLFIIVIIILIIKLVSSNKSKKRLNELEKLIEEKRNKAKNKKV